MYTCPGLPYFLLELCNKSSRKVFLKLESREIQWKFKNEPEVIGYLWRCTLQGLNCKGKKETNIFDADCQRWIIYTKAQTAFEENYLNLGKIFRELFLNVLSFRYSFDSGAEFYFFHYHTCKFSALCNAHGMFIPVTLWSIFYYFSINYKLRSKYI